MLYPRGDSGCGAGIVAELAGRDGVVPRAQGAVAAPDECNFGPDGVATARDSPYIRLVRLKFRNVIVFYVWLCHYLDGEVPR